MTSCHLQVLAPRCPTTLCSLGSSQITCLVEGALTANILWMCFTQFTQHICSRLSNTQKSKGTRQKLRNRLNRRLKSATGGGTCCRASRSSLVSDSCRLIVFRVTRKHGAPAENEEQADSSAAAAEEGAHHVQSCRLLRRQRRGEAWWASRVRWAGKLHRFYDAGENADKKTAQSTGRVKPQ